MKLALADGMDVYRNIERLNNPSYVRVVLSISQPAAVFAARGKLASSEVPRAAA